MEPIAFWKSGDNTSKPNRKKTFLGSEALSGLCFEATLQKHASEEHHKTASETQRAEPGRKTFPTMVGRGKSNF